MTRLLTPRVVLLAAGMVLMTIPTLSVQQAFSSGIARRDAVRFEQQHQRDALTCAQDAVVHGKEGHAAALLMSVDAALQHALKAGNGPHVQAAVTELKNAVEHGKSGLADVATKHVEQAVLHLSEESRH